MGPQTVRYQLRAPSTISQHAEQEPSIHLPADNPCRAVSKLSPPSGRERLLTGTRRVLDAAESNCVMCEMRTFSKRMNAAIVDPSFIANVCKKLDLRQRETAKIFGDGINAFSRYENDKTKPPLALGKLFKLRDQHSDLLSEVKAA